VATWRAAADGLATLLRLLHPLMPFVTEAIWQALGEAAPDATGSEPLLVRATGAEPTERERDAEIAFSQLAALVRGVRTLRTDAGVAASAWAPLHVAPADGPARHAAEEMLPYLTALARVRPITWESATADRPNLVAASPLGAAWLGSDVTAAADAADRRTAQLVELDANIERVRSLLANQAFVERAPEAVVARERQRLSDLERERDQVG
jgi:valyl-tRNA synthetase